MNIEHFKAIANGILFGVPFCLAAGPVFFILIYAGANRGIKLSVALAFGVLLGDLVLIWLTNYFVQLIQPIFTEYFTLTKVIMFLFLLGMGIFTIFKKQKISNNTVPLKYNVKCLFFIYGFILDVFNPSNVLIWAGVNSSMVNKDPMHHLLFYIASILTIGSLMLTLAYLSTKIEPLLGNKFLKKFNIFSGVVYLVCSFTILFYLIVK